MSSRPILGTAAPGRPAPAGRARHRVSRPLRLLLPAAVVLPLLLTLASGWLAWRDAWRDAEVEVAGIAEAAAEYAGRVLGGLLARADTANEILRGLSDAEVRAREEEVHLALRRIAERTGTLGAFHIFVHDREARSLASGTLFPVPPPGRSFGHREFNQALRAPGSPPVHVSPAYVGEAIGRPFFAVSRRREGTGNGLPPGDYDGIIAVSTDVEALGAGLQRLLMSHSAPPDVLSLIRFDGQLLARSLPPQDGLPRVELRSGFARAAAEGAALRSVYYGPSSVDGVPRLAASRRVDGWPVFATAARPRAAILARWRETVVPQAMLGGVATLALLGLALVVRRSQRDLTAANDGLERRVTERTTALAESERRNAEVLNSLGEPLCSLDADGRLVYASASALAFWGRPPGQVLGARFDDVFPEGIGTPAWEAKRLTATTGVESHLCALSAIAGRWLELDVYPRADGGITVAFRDVHDRRAAELERRRAEAALRGEQARLQAAVRGAELGVWERHLPTGSGTWDARASEIYGGLTPERCAPDLAEWRARVHPEDQAARLAAIAAAVAPGGPNSYSAEFRFRRDDGGWNWIAVHGTVVERDPLTGQGLRLAGVAQDLTARRLAEDALRSSEERLRLAQEAGGVGSWEWDVETGALHWSESCHRLHGTDPAVAPSVESWRAGIHAEDRPRLDAALQAALAGGGGPDWAVEFRFVRPADGQVRWIVGRGRILRDPATGAARRVLGIALDVTERKRAEERLVLLAREVDHRAKNALAVVQAAVRLTPRDDAAAYARAVEGRVRALAQAHNLLAERRWSGAAVGELISAELNPLLPGATGMGTVEGMREGASGDAQRVLMQGPGLTLTPTAAQSISMALHELATNAVKHGALGTAGGGVTIAWWIDATGDGVFRLRWTERGGPLLAGSPARQGFGTRVIEATVRDQLGGEVTRRWDPDGLVCEIAVPLARAVGTDAAATVPEPPRAVAAQ